MAPEEAGCRVCDGEFRSMVMTVAFYCQTCSSARGVSEENQTAAIVMLLLYQLRIAVVSRKVPAVFTHAVSLAPRKCWRMRDGACSLQYACRLESIANVEMVRENAS